jgi:hypothetical protein
MYAKSNCVKCYGRGYSGILKSTGEKLLCKCIRILKKEESTPTESLIEKSFAPLTTKIGEEIK